MNKSPLLQRAGTKKLIASVLSIVIGLFFGSILVLIVGLATSDIGAKGAWDGIRLIFIGLFSKSRDASGNLVFGMNTTNVGNMLFRATPLIMTGLSVAISQKTGLFNIGAPGQYLMGTMATLMIALSIPSTSVPPFLIWILAFLGGCIAGALWGAIPGILKAFLNINEVIACIMTNWIAANLVTWLFDIASFSTIKGSFYCQTKWKIADGTFKNLIENTKSGYVYKTTWNNVATPKFGLDKVFPGSQVNAGILIAILIAIVVFIIINKTTFGFQLKACGSNRHAARYAGIKDRANIIYSMAIAGALAAAGAALYYLSGNTEFNWHTDQTLPAIGFNGIPVALLAVNNPVGVIFSGTFMAMLNIIGTQLTKFTAYNEYITDVIIAVIVYLSAFSLVIRSLIAGKKKMTAPPYKRKIGVSILLSIVTIGIYQIYWQYLLVKNVRSIKKDKSKCTGEMLCLVFVPFYSLYWWFTRGKIVKEKFAEQGHSAAGNEIAYLILGIFGLSIVSMAIMQNDFNSLQSDVTNDANAEKKPTPPEDVKTEKGGAQA